jgi:hypothetical protein
MIYNSQSVFANKTLIDVLTVTPRLLETFDQQVPYMGKKRKKKP